jgi:hypothetical protein
LDALKRNRESFKDLNIIILIYRQDVTEDAATTFKNWISQQTVPLELSCYENWSSLPSDTMTIQLYYGPRGGFRYEGLWYITEPKIIIPFNYFGGEQGDITISFERPDHNALIIEEEDIARLRDKIGTLYESSRAKGYGSDGRTISLYDAYSILF